MCHLTAVWWMLLNLVWWYLNSDATWCNETQCSITTQHHDHPTHMIEYDTKQYTLQCTALRCIALFPHQIVKFIRRMIGFSTYICDTCTATKDDLTHTSAMRSDGVSNPHLKLPETVAAHPTQRLHWWRHWHPCRTASTVVCPCNRYSALCLDSDSAAERKHGHVGRNRYEDIKITWSQIAHSQDNKVIR